MSFEWESQNVDAILQAWYGGQAGGDAIMDVIFGDYNPGGRMPLTTYMSDNDLPPFEDYTMNNRTYRYFKGDVRYPFGYGLSYTSFAYSDLKFNPSIQTGEKVEVSFTVKNTGKRDGDEVVQLYITHPQDLNNRIPICSLKSFKRIHLKAGEEQSVTFTLTPEELALTEPSGDLMEKKGTMDIFVGGGQPKYTKGISATLTVTGDPYQVF